MSGEAQNPFNEDFVFLDQAEMKVDDKLRVGIPERFMKALRNICPEHVDKVGAVPMPDHSLKLMPYPLFMERMEQWSKLDDQVSANRTFRGFILKLAKVHTLDAQNRIKLTPLQTKFLKLKRDAIMVGNLDSMLLYDPDVYDETLSKDLDGFPEASDLVAANRVTHPSAN